jgi:predicted nucleic acid-binding protein
VIVVDASVIVEVLLTAAASGGLTERLFERSSALHAPHLIDLEVTQAVRRYLLAGVLTAGRSREAMEDLAQFPIRRHRHDVLLPKIWALRHNVSAYDAAYLALAEALDAPLVTRDARLAGTTGHRARVELL